MSVFSFLANQARKPSGWFGRMVTTRLLNSANANLENYGLDLLNIGAQDKILEIGFGNGRLMEAIAARLDSGKVAGIDISADMVKVAEKRLASFGAKAEVKKGNVSTIPYADEYFDKVFTANTVYFWPDPDENALEVKRVLKPGGLLILAFRKKEDMLRMKMVNSQRDVFVHLYNPDELAALFETNGFKVVKIHEQQDKPFDNYFLEAKVQDM